MAVGERPRGFLKRTTFVVDLVGIKPGRDLISSSHSKHVIAHFYDCLRCVRTNGRVSRQVRRSFDQEPALPRSSLPVRLAQLNRLAGRPSEHGLPLRSTDVGFMRADIAQPLDRKDPSRGWAPRRALRRRKPLVDSEASREGRAPGNRGSRGSAKERSER